MSNPNACFQMAFYDAPAMAMFMAAVWSAADDLDSGEDPEAVALRLRAAYCLFERISIAGPEATENANP